MKKSLASLFFFLLQCATAQQVIRTTNTDSVLVKANPNLEASGFHRFLFGSLWRDVWTTPVKAEILDIYSYTDSLAPTSGFHHSSQGPVFRSFLFSGKDGNEYSFTPFQQDSVSSLPGELAELLPPEVVNDQIGILNPYAPLIAVPILHAVGLPYRETRLATLPGTVCPLNEGLQREQKLGIIEGRWKFPSLDRIDSLPHILVSTSQMLDSLKNNNHHRVNELQYLKARLVDILLGDWDRSENRWQWLMERRNSHILWEPVPLKHEQAFVRINGFLPSIAELALPEFNQCDENIPDIENLTLTAQALDRRILISHTKQTWDSLARWIQARISDSVITQAITNLPNTIDEKEGKSLYFILQSRREQLPKATDEYYRFSFAYVEIFGSDKAERAEIHRIGRHMVSVEVYNPDDTLPLPKYQRLFHDDYTKEIRILLLGGDDIAAIYGEETSTIKIIIDGGNGKNELVDRSKSRSVFASLNPFTSAETFFYDNNPASHIVAGNNINVIRTWPVKTSEKKNPNEVSYRNWGNKWSFSSWLDLNPDDGLFIGGGPVYTRYEYRTDPYAELIEVRAGLATRTGRYRLDATGEFRDWFRGIRTFLHLHASQLDLSNFFGLGNETRYDQSLYDASFYKIDQQQVFLHAALDLPLMENTTAAFGAAIRFVDNNPKPGTLLDSLRLPFYNKSVTFMNLNFRIQTDSRNNVRVPTHGMSIIVEALLFPTILDNTNIYYRLRSDIRAYFTPQDFPFATLAMRTGGEIIWGNYSFFESVFLGGNESLRGFERQRFAGDASLFGGVELRARLMQIPFLVPLWMGTSLFTETGRVFLGSEKSHRWHTTFGSGIWFSIIKPEYLANFSLARSEEKFAFYATLGFMF